MTDNFSANKESQNCGKWSYNPNKLKMEEEKENALELQFGDIKFDQVQCLTQDEMFLLLSKRLQDGITNE